VVKENARLEPYIVVIGEDTLHAYLVIDNRVIDEVSFVDLPITLMAAYFVFDICYFYMFLEIVVLKYSSAKVSWSLKYLLAKINAHYVEF